MAAGSLLMASQKAGPELAVIPSHAVSAKSQTLEKPSFPLIAPHAMSGVCSQVGDEGLRKISFEYLKTGLLHTFQKPSVSTPTLSGFTAMVAR